MTELSTSIIIALQTTAMTKIENQKFTQTQQEVNTGCSHQCYQEPIDLQTTQTGWVRL